jgi:hypothetical protein
MATVELSTDQVVTLIRQLPPERKREVLLALTVGAERGRDERMTLAETEFRRLSAARKLNWDTMSDDERQAFVDELIHEDRPCQ